MTGALFDFHAPEFQADPWAVYRALRERGPVHYSEPARCHVVVGHAAVRDGLVHEDVVTDFPFRTSRRTFGHNLLDLDGAAHREFRSYLAPLLGPRAVRALLRPTLLPLVDEVVDGIEPGRETPVVAEVSAVIPYRLMCALMGLPREDAEWLYARMRPIAGTLDYPPDTSADVARAKAVVEAYFRGIIAHDRVPPDSMTRRILDTMRTAEAGFDVTEILATFLLVLLAGTETGIAALTTVLHTLATHPEAYARCREGDGATDVVREALRLRPPVHSVLRFARRDLRLHGVPVRRREPLLFSLASANRDGREFAEPDAFRPLRAEKSSLAFASGPHACPGLHLAEAELAEICTRVARRFTTLTVTPGSDRERGHSFRHAPHLTMTFA
ncbi:cytochrome P450 [Streptomyces sp. NPDC048172]|uniref:cytochrome P450 n=1 Tax=Streptomyces sp. NPDC048172 TaxID=3365505 RepID=UPI00371B04FB